MVRIRIVAGLCVVTWAGCAPKPAQVSRKLSPLIARVLFAPAEEPSCADAVEHARKVYEAEKDELEAVRVQVEDFDREKIMQVARDTDQIWTQWANDKDIVAFRARCAPEADEVISLAREASRRAAIPAPAVKAAQPPPSGGTPPAADGKDERSVRMALDEARSLAAKGDTDRAGTACAMAEDSLGQLPKGPERGGLEKEHREVCLIGVRITVVRANLAKVREGSVGACTAAERFIQPVPQDDPEGAKVWKEFHHDCDRLIH